jgi:cell division septum initiation protein DivIVA
VNHDENDIFSSDGGLSDETIDALLDRVASRYEELTPEECDVLRESVDQVERDSASHAPWLDQLPLHGFDNVRMPQLRLGSDLVSQMLLDPNGSDSYSCGEDGLLHTAAVAQETISAAKARAIGIVDDAHKHAAKILDDARQEAYKLQLIARKTLRDAHEEVDLARQKITHMRAEVQALLEEARVYRDSAHQIQKDPLPATHFKPDRADVLASLRPQAVIIAGCNSTGKTRLHDLYPSELLAQPKDDQVDVLGNMFSRTVYFERNELRYGNAVWAAEHRYAAYFDARLRIADGGGLACSVDWERDDAAYAGIVVFAHPDPGNDQRDTLISQACADAELQTANLPISELNELLYFRLDAVIGGWYATRCVAHGVSAEMHPDGEPKLSIEPCSKVVGSGA